MTTQVAVQRSTDLRDVLPIKFGKSFGWLHAGYCDVGVVICPGTGRDARSGYTAFRLLASELARTGYPTLRFDYPGAGDSLDLDGDEPCAAWLDSVRQAADRMRATGVQRIVLCGYRVGALLAATVAADRDDVAGLILIDPTTSGVLYLRELAVEQSMMSDGPGADDGRIEAEGIVLTSASDAPFRALDLMKLRSSPAPRALILASSKRPGNTKLADRLALLGAEVEQDTFEPMHEFAAGGMIDPKPPSDRIQDWLGPATPTAFRPTPAPAEAVELHGKLGSFVEHPLRFGAGQRLFGMLCRPHHEAMPGFVMVIGNAGAASHHGYAGFTVRLARRLAEAGYASLRMDYAGIGESVSEQPTHIFEADRMTDTAEAIDVLQRLGFTRFGAGGLCSAGYHGLQAGLADHRIEIMVMLNPSTFHWPKGQDFEQFIQNNSRSTNFYVETMMGRNGWKRLLRGELNVLRAVRTVRTHMLRRVKAMGLQAAGLAGWRRRAATPRQAMARLSSRGVRTLVIMGTIDAGLDVLQAHFGRGGRWLASLPGATLQLMDDVDHSLTRVAMHESVASGVIQFLRTAQPAAHPATSMAKASAPCNAPVGREAAWLKHASS